MLSGLSIWSTKNYIPSSCKNSWNKFLKLVKDASSYKNEIPRSVALNKESITTVYLHVFDDASIVASCAVIYAVVHQLSVS